METQINEFERKKTLLKEARLQLLKLHKLLVDIERENYERANGQITSGQFLNLLLNDKSFSWLRKFSTLIVEIDEMFDLDDGFSESMLDKHLSVMRDLFSMENADDDFKTKYQNILQSDTEVAGRHSEIKSLLGNK